MVSTITEEDEGKLQANEAQMQNCYHETEPHIVYMASFRKSFDMKYVLTN